MPLASQHARDDHPRPTPPPIKLRVCLNQCHQSPLSHRAPLLRPRAGILMNTKGLVELIVLNLGLDLGGYE